MEEMGDVDRTAAGASADLDRLAERIEELVAERVPHVGVVEAAELGGLGQQLGQLVGAGVGAGRVIEPARQPERAILEAFAEERPLVGQLGRAGLDLVPADSGDPEGRVADQIGDVHRDPPVVAGQVLGNGPPVIGQVGATVEARIEGQEVVEIALGPERRVGVAVDADDLGRDALADLGFMTRLGQDRQPAVAVEVDEPGGDDEPGRVDPATDRQGGESLRGVRRAAEDPERIAGDGHGAGEPGGPGPIDERAARDEDVDPARHPAAPCARIRPARRPVSGRDRRRSRARGWPEHPLTPEGRPRQVGRQGGGRGPRRPGPCPDAVGRRAAT